MLSDRQLRANRRTAWILAAVAALFAAAYVLRFMLQGG